MSAYFTPTFKAILDGSFKPTGDKPFSTYGSMKSGMIQIDDFGTAVPEKQIDKINKILGMEITFVTTAKTDEEAYALLKQFGLPFKNAKKNA